MGLWWGFTLVMGGIGEFWGHHPGVSPGAPVRGRSARAAVPCREPSTVIRLAAPVLRSILNRSGVEVTSRGCLPRGEVLLPSCPFLGLSPVIPMLFGAPYAPRLAFDGGLAAMSTEAEGLSLIVSFLPLGVLSFLLGLWRQRGSRRSWVFRWRSFLGVVCSRSRLLLFLLPSPLGKMEGVD